MKSVILLWPLQQKSQKTNTIFSLISSGTSHSHSRTQIGFFTFSPLEFIRNLHERICISIIAHEHVYNRLHPFLFPLQLEPVPTSNQRQHQCRFAHPQAILIPLFGCVIDIHFCAIKSNLADHSWLFGSFSGSGVSRAQTGSSQPLLKSLIG